MSISDDIVQLKAKAEQLLAILDGLGQQGEPKAGLFADGVRRRLTRLQEVGASEDDAMRLAMRLLDVVPSAKDLDAIDFRLDLHPAIAALRSAIEAEGARIAQALMDGL